MAVDRHGNELREGDQVRVVYGGDEHLAEVAHLYTQEGSLIPHAELQILTWVSVPTASLELVHPVVAGPSAGQPPQEPPEAEKQSAGPSQAEPSEEPVAGKTTDDNTSPDKPTAPSSRKAHSSSPKAHTPKPGGKKQ